MGIYKLIKPDMPNGLESISCMIAKQFYENCQQYLVGCTDRKSVESLYNTTIHSWISYDLSKRQKKRSFNQVLYALANDGKVCKVIKNPESGLHDIVWKN